MVKFLISILLFFCLGAGCCLAQDSTVNLSTRMFDANQAITLFSLDGWLFRQGNDPAWAGAEINTTGWQKMRPNQVNKKLADSNGKIEGWLRLKIKLDSSFGNMPLYLGDDCWGLSDIYIDDNLFHSNWSTATNVKFYKYPFHGKRYVDDIHLTWDKEHVITIHFVNYVPPSPLNTMRLAWLGPTPLLTGPVFISHEYDYRKVTTAYFTVCISLCGALSMLFWLLAIQNSREKNLSLIALCSTCFCLSALFMYMSTLPGNISLPAFLTIALLEALFAGTVNLLIPLIVAKIFTNKVSRKLLITLIAISIFYYYVRVFMNNPLLLVLSILAIVSIVFYFVITAWKILKGAQWAIVAGVLLTLFWVLLWVIVIYNQPPESFRYPLVIAITGTYLSFPLALMVYVSMRFREIIWEVRENARRLVQVTEEKKQQALNQQKVLEEEVKRQTAELRDTLENLRSAQAQLIQSEKMASLGELTAGIAHEIQNPLNFVNNFSEVNKELLEELKDEANKGNIDEVKAIASDVIENEVKIYHHGKRADSIVKGMLEHSRSSTGQKEPTDINALTNEYLRLAYHGLRAKDKSFNATLQTDFDQSIGNINIIPQDIGRVMLNLYNNAFYAVTEKAKQQRDGYEPTVSVSTKKMNDTAEIRIKDNGNGIPQKILDKIFQPFFTTKPTGLGTGLGLSLSYDIIKAHGGEIKVETKEEDGVEFIIRL